MLGYEDELTPVIEDPFLREIETILLMRIYEWNHIRVDRVIEPFIDCPVVFSDSGFGITGYEPSVGNTGKNRFEIAKHYEPLIFPGNDIEKIIKIPVVEYDETATMARYNLLNDIFYGIIPVKLFGRCHFHCAPMDEIIIWTGIDNAMVYLSDEPEFMHALLNRYMEAQISRIKQYEKFGILSSNNRFVNVGNNCPGHTSRLPPPPENGIGAKIKNIWGENSDQIMTAVSPEMSNEFCFEHEKEWAKLFGLYSYGCCEKLDHKLEFLTAAFPNLRKVSSSPFNDLEKTADQLGNKYVISFKPNSAWLAGEKPEIELLRRELINGCRLAEKYGLNLVFNMKTMITLRDDPRRLWNWCDMAMEIVRAHFGG